MKKEEFLVEHNRLSPSNLQATLALLDEFKQEKKPQLADEGWSIEKLRAPFISWILSLKLSEDKKDDETEKESKFRNYPETKYI